MIITYEDFFFNTPLYEAINFSDCDNIRKGILHNSYSKLFDGYNPISKIESTFVVDAYNDYLVTGYYQVNIVCRRTGAEFPFYVHNNHKEKTLIKVGQFPSVADFHTQEIKKYRKILTAEKMVEFSRAVGLVAHGVGIGSFVYLRRIFEDLIMQAYRKALVKEAVTEKEFMSSRMDEKIALLSYYLPEFLVENKVMYSILSKGIHELDEQTCLASFEPLRMGIEMILDEQLAALEKEEKRKVAREKILKLSSELKK